jgi:outer membrane protein
MIPQNLSLLASSLLAASFLLRGTEAVAQTPMPVRTNWVVGSDELIRIALIHNLNIRLSEIQPEIDQYALNGLYGAYEPNATLNVVHDYNSSPSGVASNGVPLPALTEQINSYTPGINGATPWGLTYSLTGPLTELNQKYLPDLYTSSPGITLFQPLLKNLWTDNNRYQISLSKSTLKQDQLALRNQIMTVVNSIKAAYYTLISDRELVSVQEMAVKLAEETANEDAQKLKAGALAPLDEQQAESQAASARSDLLTARATLASQENTIKGLLGIPADAWLTFTPVPAERLMAIPESPDVHECWRVAFQQRPDMLQAKIKAETQHVLLKFDFNQLFPEIDVIGGYGRNATELTFAGNLDTIRQGTYPFYDYGVVMTIPLGGNINARNKYKADKAALQQLVLQIKILELTIIPTIDNDVTKVRTDYLKVDSTRQARIYAEQALQGQQTMLEHGKNTSFFVLQAQQTLTARRSDEIQALANYNIDLDQLAFDEGTILDRNHIDLRVR